MGYRDQSDQLTTEFWRYPKPQSIGIYLQRLKRQTFDFFGCVTARHEWEHYRRYPKLIINYINYIYWIAINHRLIMDIFPQVTVDLKTAITLKPEARTKWLSKAGRKVDRLTLKRHE